MSNCLDVSDVDDMKDFQGTIVSDCLISDCSWANLVQNAMNVIGLSAQEQYEIFKMLAIILWLGNVQFEDNDNSGSNISDSGVTDFVAYLMEVDSTVIQKVLTSRTVETTRNGRRGSVYEVPLNPSQANSGRDALSKAIYNNLFEWIVSRVNMSMKTRSAYAHVIGILVHFVSSIGWTELTEPFRISSDSKSLRTTHLNSSASIMSTKSCSKSLSS